MSKPTAEMAASAKVFDNLRKDVPNPKQLLFFKSRAKHTAYGGARG